MAELAYDVMTSLCHLEVSLRLSGWVGGALGSELGVGNGVE